MNKGPCLILIKPSTNNLTQSTSENNLDTCNTRSVLNLDIQTPKLHTQNLAKIYGEYYSDKSCGDFDPTNTFRMKGQNISVNNLAYNDNNVIHSNMTKFVPMEIEVFRTTCDI
ncbi:unnamed protein product [Rhizophagus irregularis]|nr:unnamed protein product [Rhizophagus irregularis]